MKPKLLPCPHCGRKARFGTNEDGGEFAECSNCGASTKLWYPNKMDVKPLIAEAWNDRYWPDNIVDGFATVMAAFAGLKAQAGQEEWKQDWKPLHKAWRVGEALSAFLWSKRETQRQYE